MSLSQKTKFATALSAVLMASSVPTVVWASAPPAEATRAPAKPAALPDVEGPSEAPPHEPGPQDGYPSTLPAPSGADGSPAVGPPPATGSDVAPSEAPSSEPPPPTMQEPTILRVAVGLASELDGNKMELELLDTLEKGVRDSVDPQADVRRLRVGAAQPRELCREGRDDLIISVDYMPEREDPVLSTHDCRIDDALGIRAAAAASDPLLLGVLWDEHAARVADGARERRRGRVSPKVRTGIIAGVAVVVVGAAIGLLIAGAVQKESVVLVITPSP